MAQAQGELAFAPKIREQRSAKESDIALAEIHTPIQEWMVNDPVKRLGVVVEEPIDMIEPLALHVGRLRVRKAQNVSLAHEACSFRRLLRRCAELRLDELWQPLQEKCAVN
jgi:hypothetical protein